MSEHPGECVEDCPTCEAMRNLKEGGLTFTVDQRERMEGILGVPINPEN